MSWQIKLTGVAWTVPPTGNQLVDIGYRQGGTASAFTSVGTATFDPAGNIVGTPNPIIISGIDAYWASVDVQYINECNGISIVKNFLKV